MDPKYFNVTFLLHIQVDKKNFKPLPKFLAVVVIVKQKPII